MSFGLNANVPGIQGFTASRCILGDSYFCEISNLLIAYLTASLISITK